MERSNKESQWPIKIKVVLVLLFVIMFYCMIKINL